MSGMQYSNRIGRLMEKKNPFRFVKKMKCLETM